MGSLVGHVLPGLAFLALGLWHLFNQIKLHSLHPNSYTSSAWFPTSKLRHLELLLIMLGCTISISAELFIGPAKHHPFDVDGTIPANHLRNFEHSSISLSFLAYAASAILLDKRAHLFTNPQHLSSLTHLVGAISFGQQLLLFRLHSTDHKGLEGQYHLFLQILVVISLATTLLGISHPKSFLVGFVRSVAVSFQGVWFIVMGYMLWTPALLPKGCILNDEDGHFIARCGGEESLHRAKSLVNILFSWLVVGVTASALFIYLALIQTYGPKVEYSSLDKEIDECQDVELEKKYSFGECKSFIPVASGLVPSDMER